MTLATEVSVTLHVIAGLATTTPDLSVATAVTVTSRPGGAQTIGARMETDTATRAVSEFELLLGAPAS
ncbi:MAG: hypothetical protein M3Z05_00560 [Gemmatimonadota bacterium]|nr:hypothetical protein [Gemmatimonadota bacterium]